MLLVPIQFPVLEREVLDTSLRAWLVFLVVLGVGLAILMLARRLVLSRLTRLAARTATRVDDVVADLLERTGLFAALFLTLLLAAQLLSLPPEARQTVQKVAVIAALIQTGLWGSGLIAMAITRMANKGITGETGATTIAALSYTARALLWIILFMVALDNLDVDITALVTGLGVGGIAIALAVQNILGDLFAALSIVLDKPFVVGDQIEVDTGFSGTVEHIGLKSTRLRSLSGEQLIFSNAKLLQGRIRNFQRMRERRVVFNIGLDYSTPVDTVARVAGLLREAVETQGQTRFDRAHFSNYLDSSLAFEVVYFVTTPEYNIYMDTQHAINLEILRRLKEEKIEFAFPTRTLVLRAHAGDRGGEGGAGGRSATEVVAMARE